MTDKVLGQFKRFVFNKDPDQRRESLTDRAKKFEKKISNDSEIGQDWKAMMDWLVKYGPHAKKVAGGIVAVILCAVLWLVGWGACVLAVILIGVAIALPERASKAALIIAVFALVIWFSERLFGLGDPSQYGGIYLGGWTPAICLVVIALLWQGGTSDRITLVATMVLSLVGIWVLKFLGIDQAVGGFGHLLSNLFWLGTFVAVTFWVLITWGFGNRRAAWLGAIAAGAVWANWLLFSETDGARTGLFGNTHPVQLGAFVFLVLISRSIAKRRRHAIVAQAGPGIDSTTATTGEQDPFEVLIPEGQRRAIVELFSVDQQGQEVVVHAGTSRRWNGSALSRTRYDQEKLQVLGLTPEQYEFGASVLASQMLRSKIDPNTGKVPTEDLENAGINQALFDRLNVEMYLGALAGATT